MSYRMCLCWVVASAACGQRARLEDTYDALAIRRKIPSAFEAAEREDDEDARRGKPTAHAWLTAHLFFLIGFRNCLVVLVDWDWAWSYLSYQRNA